MSRLVLIYIDPKSLPHAIKEQLSDPILEQESVALVDLAPEIQERLWCTFVDVLNPFVVNNMMVCCAQCG